MNTNFHSTSNFQFPFLAFVLTGCSFRYFFQIFFLFCAFVPTQISQINCQSIIFSVANNYRHIWTLFLIDNNFYLDAIFVAIFLRLANLIKNKSKLLFKCRFYRSRFNSIYSNSSIHPFRNRLIWTNLFNSIEKWM